MSRHTPIARQVEIRVRLASDHEAAKDQAEIEPDRLAEDPPHRRTLGETSRLLSILDEIGKESE